MKIDNKNIDIILNTEFLNWEEAVIGSSKPLFDKGKIEKRYIDTMIKNNLEYNAYFVIQKGIALLHARPEDGVNDSGLVILTLKKPLNFGSEENDPVSLIFCLATKNSEDHIDFLRNLMEIIDDEKNINKILSADKKEDIIKILFDKK